MYIGDDYVFLLPQYQMALAHSHSMLHIFLARQPIEVRCLDQQIIGHFIVLDSDCEHEVKMGANECLVYLIDPSSVLCEQIRQKYLHSARIVCPDMDEPIKQFLIDSLDCERKLDGSDLFKCMELKYTGDFQEKKDERIQQVIHGVKSGIFLNLEVKEIAGRVYLSESHLSHLFKAETGMNLKNYLLMNKLKVAFERLNAGMNITESAQAANFFDAAHLCNLVKKTTGLNISEIFPS
ncbi:MAG: helix-turn-helix domain-containing protein [Eubacteriales bacterium]|nr:helix-turn-helix domain-containing protein [Eubacteriales bacterium]